MLSSSARVMRTMNTITMLSGTSTGSKRDFIDRQQCIALLIIDVQQDFCPVPAQTDPKGWAALPVPGGNEIVPLINKLKAGFPFGRVFLTLDYHPRGHVSFASSHPGHALFSTIDVDERGTMVKQALWPDHCVMGTDGAEPHPDLKIAKGAYDNVRETPFIDEIYYKGRDILVDSYSAFYDNAGKSTEIVDTMLKTRNIKEVVVVGIAFDFCVGSTALDAVKDGYKTTVCCDTCAAVNDSGFRNMVMRLLAAGVTLTTCDAFVKSRKKQNACTITATICCDSNADQTDAEFRAMIMRYLHEGITFNGITSSPPPPE